MIEIQAEGLVKSFDLEKKILDGLTFQVDQGERVGLLGRNGAGKTTLFRILTGELDCDSGCVTIGTGRRLGLISQIPVYPEGFTVEDVLRTAFARLQSLAREMETLTARMTAGETDPALLRRYGALSEKFETFGGYDTDVAVNKVANGLSISGEMRHQLFESLSGGEKTRVNLGRLILEDTDILLLDEPTNHLDLHATEWLEEYIRTFQGTVVVISHDRYFLDRVVTRIIEIQDGKAEFYSGNYSFYAVEKERRFQERMKQYQKEQAKIAQLTEAADKLRLWAFLGNDALYKRAFSMEKRIERMRTTDKPTQARKMDARFSAAEFHGDEVLALRNLGKSFGDKHLFSQINLKVQGGERIALIGDNGTGKSTLIKMIMNEEFPDDGRIRLGPSVKPAYLPQVIRFDHPDWNLVENMMAARKNLSAQSARNRLAAYDFRGEDVFKTVSVLSGGEMSRLRLCMLMDDEINFLILDEPTNHLDIDSREWIENAVESYDGTLLFVSHDRYFINRFATRIWELADGTITDWPMGFAQYRQQKALEEESHKKDSPVKNVKQNSITEKPRGNRGQQAAKRQLTICEREIAKAEERLARLDGEMEAAACDYEKLNGLTEEKAAAQAELDALYEKWEALSEEAEA
ncbi:MAG: ABC-F family ATP-binding cassette domain-containing protein [Oscillibacter sp.]|jgi:ATPase subunit of ABC transporter with duplicated ATPase domains|nr:ABC-F family ATP-binding cassette domain-containing protein [Oscillibacter sp.]